VCLAIADAAIDGTPVWPLEIEGYAPVVRSVDVNRSHGGRRSAKKPDGKIDSMAAEILKGDRVRPVPIPIINN
jgi:hypothetical protein